MVFVLYVTVESNPDLGFSDVKTGISSARGEIKYDFVVNSIQMDFDENILPSIFKPNENLAGEVFATILERCGVSMEHDAGLGVGKGTSITAGLCNGTTTGSAVMKISFV